MRELLDQMPLKGDLPRRNDHRRRAANAPLANGPAGSKTSEQIRQGSVGESPRRLSARFVSCPGYEPSGSRLTWITVRSKLV